MSTSAPQDPIIYTARRVLVNGLDMYYEEYGKGKPLVLLHGGGSTIHTSFGRIIQLLARQRRVIAVELQAHGHSGDRQAPISFRQDADDVASLLNELKLEKADLMGFSNGGTTVLEFAIRHPQKTGSIIVASGMYSRAGAPPEFWEFMKNGKLEDMPPQLVAAYNEAAQDSTKLGVMFRKCADRMINFTDIPEEAMSKISAPALIISGDHDVTTPQHAVDMHRLIRGSRLCILPGEHGTYMGEITTMGKNQGDYSGFVDMLENFLGDTH